MQQIAILFTADDERIRMADERLLTVDEVAERLRVHPESVRRWFRQGVLRGSKFGRRGGYRVSETELRRFIDSRTAGGPGQQEA
jgi:excisionase family DNA binding protein